jgi:hypothetical protein
MRSRRFPVLTTGPALAKPPVGLINPILYNIGIAYDRDSNITSVTDNTRSDGAGTRNFDGGWHGQS